MNTNINIDKFIYALVYIIVAFIFYFILKRLIRIFLEKPKEKLGSKLTSRQIQRMGTIQAMLDSALKYIILVALILALLANFGVDVSSLLAGLGIATAIVGLAFQDLAKDVIAGFTIIMDSQYEVGDLIEVNEFRGRVTSVSLKSTRVKNYRGKELVIANRNMSSVINHSTHNTLAEVDIPVAYETDLNQVEKALEKVCNALRDGALTEDIVGEVEYYGPVKIDNSAIVWRINAECLPYKHFKPQRLIRRLVLQEFKKSGIKIPYDQLEIHQGN